MLTPYLTQLESVTFVLKTLTMFAIVFVVSLVFILYISNYVDVFVNRKRYALKAVSYTHLREKGGTVSTIRMVHAQRKEMREVPVGSYLPESMINLGYFRNASGR